MLGAPQTRSRRLLAASEKSLPLPELKLDFSLVKNWFEARKTKLPALIMSGIFFWLTSSLLQRFYPAQLENWLIPGSYIVLLLSAGVFLMYFLSYVLMNARQAFFISVGCSWLIWLKLHQFELDLKVVGFTLTGMLLMMLITANPKARFSSKS